MELSSLQPAYEKKSYLMAGQTPKLKNRTLGAIVIQQRLQFANRVVRSANKKIHSKWDTPNPHIHPILIENYLQKTPT
jgi:hypothetical protein